MLYETGLIGVAFWVWFFTMVFRDSKKLSRQPGLPGALGLGWCGVVLILVASILYKNWVNVNAILYTFWYMTGLMVAFGVRGQPVAAADPTPGFDAPGLRFPRVVAR